MKLRCFIMLLLSPMLVGAVSLPAPLGFKDHPVDPLCLLETEHTSARVDLNHCGIHAVPGRTIVGKNEQLLAKGFVGYDYTVRINPKVSLHGYAYYKAWGTDGSAVIVQTLFHGGGTGEVSSLRLIERVGSRMKVSVLQTGDRCNHGLVDVVRESEYLVYRVKLTSYDFLTLAHANPHDLKAYDDLEDCAICCKATAVFQRKLGADITHETLRYVDLATFPQEDVSSDASKPNQVLFDQLFRRYVKAGQSTLDAKQLTAFVREFNQTVP